MTSGDTRVVPFVIPANRHPFGVTNQKLLELLFGDQWDQVLVTSFTRDPADPNAPREDWNGWPAGQVLGNPNFDAGNTYFCPSLLAPGQPRHVEHFRQLNVVIIDDIGTKVRLTDVEKLLGTGPTYVIETSPGNCQVGWKLEPETDLAWVKGILTQLDKALGGADNLTNPVAWRRLPVGFNTKAAQIQQWGPKGWKVTLTGVIPRLMIRRVDWIHIADQIGDITRLSTTDRGKAGDGAKPDDVVLGQDPVYQALEAAGYILGDKITSDKYWAATIRCPWVSNHGPTRPLTGAEYVPAVPGQKGWFHCFHCERRDQAEFREELDKVLRQEGHKTVAFFDFEPVDPAAVTFASVISAGDQAIDLWSQKVPPEWPGGIFPGVVEDTLAELAEGDRLDLGALGAALMTAASGAADKRSRLVPYAGSNWVVAPILWLMLVADPGMRKTAILNHVTRRLRDLNATRMARHVQDLNIWNSLPGPQRRQLPAPRVEVLLAADTTIEKLQEWMSWNPRGLLYLRDELAGLFDFARYQTGAGAAARANFLEFYEGGPTTIGRMTRTTTIAECGLSIIGGIQPNRLAEEFKALTGDGMLSRFGTVMMRQPQSESDQSKRAAPPDTSPIETTIERLLALGAGDYTVEAAGEDLIRDTEGLGAGMAQQPDVGVGYGGFLSKLHGLHARVALVLHLIDGGGDPVVPHDTVLRARRYTGFLLDHAEIFYAELAGSAEKTAQAIGSFLLRHPMKRVTAGRLRADVAPCKQLRTLKEIQDAVFLLVIGGWLKAESPYAAINNAWVVRPGLQGQFAARTLLETQRIEDAKVAMNHRGLYR